MHGRTINSESNNSSTVELSQLVREDTELLNKAITWLKDQNPCQQVSSASDTPTILLTGQCLTLEKYVLTDRPLTGVTGFLGSFLLTELFRVLPPHGQIICLIRNKSNPLQSIATTLRKYEIDSNLVDEITTSPRITWLEGDLKLPYFGLQIDIFIELARKVCIAC